MDYVSLKIPMGLKAQKTHKKVKGSCFPKLSLLEKLHAVTESLAQLPRKQGMEPVVRQPISSCPHAYVDSPYF